MNKTLQFSIFILLFIAVGIFVSGTTIITDTFINGTNATFINIYGNLTGNSNSTTWWASASGFVTNYLFKNGNNLDINETALNNSINNNPKNWISLQNYPVACPGGSYVTQLNDSVTCSAISGDAALETLNITGINYNYSRPQGGSINYRPLFSTASEDLTVCTSGCEYTTIQAAVNQVPYFLNHVYRIMVSDGTYAEDVFVPPVVASDIISSVDGPCEALQIIGNVNNINGVKVRSFQVSGSTGCQTPAIKYFQMTGADPYSDENVSIAVYGASHPVIKYINFTGVIANYGVMSYGSSITIEAIDFGVNNLNTALLVKHGGVIYFNNAANIGRVKSNLGQLDAGQIFLNNDTKGMTWVGDIFIYPADDSSIATSKDLTKSRAKLHIVNYFEEPIQPQQIGASSNGLVGYYKADTLDDYSGNGYNVSALNSANTTTGKFGESFTADGTNKTWTAANTVLRSNLTGFSYFGWAKIVGASATSQVIFRTGSTGVQTAGFYFGADGTQLICASTLNGTHYETQKNVNIADPYINQADWHFYGCAYNGTYMNYYVDGQYIASVDTINNGVLNLSTTALTLGARSGGSHNINGSFDEVMIFNRTMTDSEMRSWYERGVSEFTSPKANYLKGVDVNPITTSLYNLGSSTLRWFKGWFVNLDVSGTLNVTGNVTVGLNSGYFIIPTNTTTKTCGAATVGAIYYDNVSQKHYGCNSTNWNALY